MRFAHVMIRVNDLEESLGFYTQVLGMKLLKTSENTEYQYTLAFLGYGDINNHTVVELTYNWGKNSYEQGTAFGHLAIAVEDVPATCELIRAKGGTISREAGPVKGGTTIIAFVKDPNGYSIELVEDKPQT